MKKTICGVLIAKDESAVIERCLDSIKPLIDFLHVDDTGSVDDTQFRVDMWREQNGMDGLCCYMPWVDFAFNRTEAIAYASNEFQSDYILTIDADEVLNLAPDFDPVAFKESLTADIYNVPMRLGGTNYTLPKLFRNNGKARYRGVTHEFLEMEGTHAPAKGLLITSEGDGSRRNGNKFQNDLDLMLKAMEAEEDPFMRTRYTFYIAQTLKDMGRHWDALEFYRHRVGMGFWGEEVFWSLYQIARMIELTEGVGESALSAYLAAWEYSPGRAEAIRGAAWIAAQLGRTEVARLYRKEADSIPKPESGLFVEEWAYKLPS